MPTLQSQIRWCARAQWTLAGLMLAMVLGFCAFAYRPMTAETRALRAQVARTQEELSVAKAQTKVLPAVALKVERLRARLERSKKSIPQQPELPQFIKDVTQLSQQSRLGAFGIKPEHPRRLDMVSELPIQLSFEGDFVNVFSFLRNTEEMPRLSRVRGMTIRHRERDRAGQVQVQLSMNIYFGAE
jgi:Tfp pilus assembly protein PilO